MADPYVVLGIARDATDEVIRQAYLAAVQRCPAERDPEGFRSIQAAYERLRTERGRREYALFDTEPPEPADLLMRLMRGARPARPGRDLFRELLRSGGRGRRGRG